MTNFIKQCKGTDSDSIKDLENLWLNYNPWYSSIKYDGQYVQIHIYDSSVNFFTSAGKLYKNQLLANEILKALPKNTTNIILEGEYLGYGNGKLGGRKDAATVTTLRTLTNRGEVSSAAHKIRIFDLIDFNLEFKDRLEILKSFNFQNDLVKLVDYTEYLDLSLNDAKKLSSSLIANGYEGLFCKSSKHLYLEGKRVKTALKFKAKHIKEAKVIDIMLGSGKYSNMIGSLICKDDLGLTFSVGSGLTDSIRSLTKDEVVGKTCQFKYESKTKTYVMPSFIKFVN